MGEDSQVLGPKHPCKACSSSDGLQYYTDGHGYCFVCETWFPPEGENKSERVDMENSWEPVFGEFKTLKSRGLKRETCERWGYTVGEFKGRKAQIASYYRDSELVGQKVRFPDKDFMWLGGKKPGLYGQHLWKEGGQSIIVCEGEIDALTLNQMFGNKYPVVSIPRGANSAKKTFEEELMFLNSFDKVVVMFDNDDAGNKAVESVKGILEPGKLHVAKLPLKDPNEMFVAGRGQEVWDAFINAKPFLPSDIKMGSQEAFEKLLMKEEEGLTYPWPTLTKTLHGLHTGRIYLIGAGTGMGKTQLTKEILYHLAMEHDEKVGMILTEELEKDTLLSIMAMNADKRLNIWDVKNKEDEGSLKFYYDQTIGTGKFLYVNKFGDIDEKWAVDTIRLMSKAYGVKYIMLDHLGSIAAGALTSGKNEREAIDVVMPRLANVVRDTGVTLFLLSHVNTPESGRAFEEGGEVSLRNFRGSRSIGQWADGAWALIRNQKDTDIEKRSITDLVILKDRQIGGLAVGQRIQIRFDSKTGRLSEFTGTEIENNADVGEFDAVEDKGTEILDKPINEPEVVADDDFADF